MKPFSSLLAILALLPSSFAGPLCSRFLKVVLESDQVNELLPFAFNCKCDLRLRSLFRPIQYECTTELCSTDILNNRLVADTIPIDIPLINEPCITPTLSGTMAKLGGGDMTVRGCTGTTDVTVNVTAIVENIASEYLDEILAQYVDELFELFLSDYLNGRGDFSQEKSVRMLLDSVRMLEDTTTEDPDCELTTLEDIITCEIATLEELLSQTSLVALLDNTDLEVVLNNYELVAYLVYLLDGTDINDLLEGNRISDLLNYDRSTFDVLEFFDLTDINIFDYFSISDIFPGLEEIMTYSVPNSCLTVDTKRSLLLNGVIQFYSCEMSIGGKSCGCEVCGENGSGVMFTEACYELALEELPEGLKDFIPFSLADYCLDAAGLVNGRGAADVMLAPFTTFGVQS